ncbi:fasciclin domain-containing protein [Iodidimonas sp. SYSU 1G8]
MRIHTTHRALMLAAAVALTAAPTAVLAESMGAPAAQASSATKMVGGAAMSPSKNIVENASASKDHTTLVAAVKAAGLVETLQGPGPFTVFAPTDAAFAKLPAGTVDTLVKPENKEKLTGILTYHVVAGDHDAASIAAAAKANGGKAEFTTVQGGKITLMEKDGGWWVKDTKGNKAKITIADVDQSNGVVHVIDTVLMP